MEIYEARKDYQFRQTAPLPHIRSVASGNGLSQPGIKRARRERLVMNYVEANGSITRGEAAELCRIDSAKASQLLRRLRDQGDCEWKDPGGQPFILRPDRRRAG